MCGHDWKNVNEVKVCTKCGLTMPDGGRPFFDKKIVAYFQKRKRGKEHG